VRKLQRWRQNLEEDKSFYEQPRRRGLKRLLHFSD